MVMWLLVAAFFVILLTLVGIHVQVNGGFKVETSWIAIALVPAVIWLVATDQLAEFSGFGMAFKLRQAAAQPFSLALEGSKIEPVPLTLGEKGGIGDISELVQNRVTALTFKLGRQGYYKNQAIWKYLDELTQHDFFRYVVFITADRKFRGLIPASALLGQRQREENLNLAKVIEERALNRLDGLVTAKIKAAPGTKREALSMMEADDLTELPVVDAEEQLIGIIEREKLLSSILLDLITQL